MSCIGPKKIKAKNAGKLLTGKRAIVVGATSGIGASVARRLAQAQASVTILGRNAERGNKVVEDMKQLGPSDGKYNFRSVDVLGIQTIKDFCDSYKEENESLDMLVLSQGLGTMANRTLTPEGIDRKLCINYYGRVAMTQELMPLLETAEQPKVLSILSAGMHNVYKGWKTDTELKDTYSMKNAADAAGFYNDIAWDHLSKEHSSVSFIHSCPGFVNTDWGAELSAWARYPMRFLQRTLGRSPADCAEVMVNPLLDEKLQPGFHLFGDDGQVAKIKDMEQHEAATETVWTHTMDLLKRALATHESEKTPEANE